MAVLTPVLLSLAGCSNSTSSSTFYVPSFGRDIDEWFEKTRPSETRRDEDHRGDQQNDVIENDDLQNDDLHNDYLQNNMNYD